MCRLDIIGSMCPLRIARTRDKRNNMIKGKASSALLLNSKIDALPADIAARSITLKNIGVANWVILQNAGLAPHLMFSHLHGMSSNPSCCVLSYSLGVFRIIGIFLSIPNAYFFRIFCTPLFVCSIFSLLKFFSLGLFALSSLVQSIMRLLGNTGFAIHAISIFASFARIELTQRFFNWRVALGTNLAGLWRGILLFLLSYCVSFSTPLRNSGSTTVIVLSIAFPAICFMPTCYAMIRIELTQELFGRWSACRTNFAQGNENNASSHLKNDAVVYCLHGFVSPIQILSLDVQGVSSTLHIEKTYASLYHKSTPQATLCAIPSLCQEVQ